MEPWVAVVMLLVAVLGLPWALLGGLDLLKRWAWLQAARRLGLQFEPGGLLAGDALHGHRNGYPVWILAHHRRQTFARLRLPDFPDGIELRAAGWLRDPGTQSLGDRIFDRRVAASGPEGPLRARLGLARRRRIAAQLQHPPGPLGAELWVAGGEIAFACPGMILRTRRLERIVQAMEDLAEALSVHRGVPEQLSEVALDGQEPPVVREGALRALVLRYPGSAATTRAAHALLQSPKPTLRLWAGRGLARTPAGATVLQTMTHNKNLPASLRAEALRRMADVETVSVRDTATAVLETGPAELRTTAAKRLATYPESLSNLVRRTRRETDKNAQLALVHGILRQAEPQHSPQREAALLRLIQSTHRQVRSAAVQGLGRVGGRSAIPPLKAIRRARWHDPGLGRHVAAALHQIRARLGPAQAGQLSVADEPSEGSLTLSPARRGALTVSEPESDLLPPTG